MATIVPSNLANDTLTASAAAYVTASGTSTINGAPALIRWPTCTLRLVTTPPIGARITVRSRLSRARLTRACAATAYFHHRTTATAGKVRVRVQYTIDDKANEVTPN